MLYYAFYCDKISAIKSNIGRQICRQTFMRTGSGCSLRSSKKYSGLQRKIEGFLYKPCEYKVGNELPVVDESFKSFEKMTAGAENMMHTPGSIKTDCSERTDRQKSRAYRLHSA